MTDGRSGVEEIDQLPQPPEIMVVMGKNQPRQRRQVGLVLFLGQRRTDLKLPVGQKVGETTVDLDKHRLA